MSNTSILAAFERMWQHVVNAIGTHVHDDRYYTETEIDSKISNVNTSITNIVNGTTTVKKAESATSATTASNAEKLGNQSPSYYAAASAIPTGALANKSTVSESDLDSTLAQKVNAAAQGNHSHSNKTVLDGITSTKVSAWDSAESNAKTYTDGQISSHSHNTATTSKAGFMSTDMVTKLNGIATGAQVNTITGVKGNSETSYRTGNVNITKSNIGLGNVDNTSDTNKPVSTAQQTAIDNSLASAKSYTDGKIDALVGEGASETLDTIGEISAAIEENQDMLGTLNSAIGNKVDKVSGKGLSTNDYTTTEKNKLSGIASGAEVNQNAFSNITVGSTTIAADSKTDTLTLVAGSNITLTPDATNDKITIAATDTTYTLGSFGITASATELNYTDGVTSNIQTQLDGKQATINGGASTIASSNLTASRALVSNSSGKVAVSAVTSTELGYLDGVTSAIQTQLDGKSPTSHGHDNATTSVAGFMSAADKSKLDGITASADSVAFSQSLTSGAEVGTITINGAGTKLYAPLNTNTTYDLNTSQVSGQNVKLNLVAGGSGSGTDSIEIKGGGATSVTRDTTTGAIIIESTDHDTTYGAAGTSLGLVKSGGDVTIASGLITVNDDSHNHVISNVDGLQAALDTKSDSSHTHNYAGSSSAGGAATSANKVNSSLTVKLNSGTTEGTNMFTFNGSAAKSVNITPSAIGASASGHTHDDRYYTESEIDTKLSGKSNSGHGHDAATQSAAGFMSANDKKKLDGIASGANAYTHPSTHAASMITGLATVATSGSYNDLSNKPTIPQLNDSTSSTSTTTAATANAVQLAYSKAVTAQATASSALDTANAKSTVAESSTNGKVTVNGTDIKVYEHPTTAGNKHIPTGGSNGQVLKWGASGTAVWGTDNNTTYTFATGDNNGTIKVTPSGGSAQNIAVKGLGSVAYTSTVPVANGGTGATTAAGALTNLGAMDLASDQTASGIKTFTNGINIGNALLSYDSENKRVVITVS